MIKDNRSDSDYWQTIYCALMLIIVAFFMFLISVSKLEKAKLKSFTDTYRSDAIVTATRQQLETNDGQLINDALFNQLGGRLDAILENTGYKGAVGLERVPGGIKATIISELLFESATAHLKRDFLAVLDEISNIAKESELSLAIEGHTDNQAIISDKYPSNWELSTARAVSLLKYFLESGGIPPERLRAAGFGQYRPIADNETPEGRKKNRRAELYLFPASVNHKTNN